MSTRALFYFMLVDEKGNQLLTVNGNGLSEAVSVTVCDKECMFSSLPSSSEYKCITPPGTGKTPFKLGTISFNLLGAILFAFTTGQLLPI